MRAGCAVRRALTVTLALAASGCSAELPPHAQVLLHVDTDAPVPPVFGQQVSLSEPQPLFDTLRVDVFEPGETEPCDGCSRGFALDVEMFHDERVSFGVPVAPGVSGYRVRLRMYPSRATLSGEPPPPDAAGNPPGSVLETTVALPVVDDGSILDRSVFLATETVGVPQGSLDSPFPTTEVPEVPSWVGTWPGAARVPCAGNAAEGRVCVPGGAFWMGNARVSGQGVGDAANRLRLVVLSPYFLEADEVTVGRIRAAGVTPEYVFSGGTTGNSFRDFCTFTADPTGLEDVPINCISRETAKAFCQAQGGDMPTEAQFEYVASAFQGRLYVWGEDDPTCDDAVLGRAGWGILSAFNSPCKTETPPGGALVVGSLAPARRDRLDLPGGSIHDLVGNMCEFTRDMWNQQDEPCWSSPGVYEDPVCETPSPADGLKYTYRGGCWDLTARLATSATREGIADSAMVGLIGLGFRCAYPAAP
jgi:sulfatase modifying factor 1